MCFKFTSKSSTDENIQDPLHMRAIGGCKFQNRTLGEQSSMEILLDSLHPCLLVCCILLCHVVITKLDCVVVIVKAGKWTHIVLYLHVRGEVTLSE